MILGPGVHIFFYTFDKFFTWKSQNYWDLTVSQTGLQCDSLIVSLCRWVVLCFWLCILLTLDNFVTWNVRNIKICWLLLWQVLSLTVCLWVKVNMSYTVHEVSQSPFVLSVWMKLRKYIPVHVMVFKQLWSRAEYCPKVSNHQTVRILNSTLELFFSIHYQFNISIITFFVDKYIYWLIAVSYRWLT